MSSRVSSFEVTMRSVWPFAFRKNSVSFSSRTLTGVFSVTTGSYALERMSSARSASVKLSNSSASRRISSGLKSLK